MESDRKIITLFENEDFKVICEEPEGVPFLHCYVVNFNKDVARAIKEVWEEIKIAFVAHGHEEVFSYVRAPARFGTKLLGGEIINTFEEKGVEFEVLRWDLKQ